MLRIRSFENKYRWGQDFKKYLSISTEQTEHEFKGIFKTHPLWKTFLEDNYGTEQLDSTSGQKHMVDIKKTSEQKEMYIKGQMRAHRAIARCLWGGHKYASLDPLNETRPPYVVESWLPKDDYEIASHLPYSPHEYIRIPHNISLIGGFNRIVSVENLFTKMKSIYAQSIGVEETQQLWFRRWWVTKRFELKDTLGVNVKVCSPLVTNDTSSKLVTLRRLIQAYSLEDWFLQHPELTKGLGVEILSTSLQSLTDFASLHSGQHFNISMSTKRGRLNVMLNALRKPPEQVLAPLQDFSLKGRYLEPSDRTSLGVNSSKVSSKSNDPFILNLLSNVHLYPDSQTAIIHGKTLSDQLFYRDIYRKKVWQVIIHDDRAISSHGSIYEMMRLGHSPNYHSKGEIHIVICDQDKFEVKKRVSGTEESRYCTDMAKANDTLILHVNASDVEAVEFCFETATEYKALFHESALINLVCTPEDRAKTSKYFWKSVIENSLTQSLIKEGRTSEGIIWKNIDSLHDLYTSKYNLREFNVIDWVDSPWKNASVEGTKYLDPITGITQETLQSSIKSYHDFLDSIEVHKSVAIDLGKRKKMAEQGIVTWILAENLAIQTLIKNRVNVRLTGEEVLYPKTPELSRYLKLFYLKKPHSYSYLDGTIPTKATLKVSSSPASQNCTLAFELGFSSANPKSVSIWQSTKGSLSRIQYLLDVYIAGGEIRWLRQTSLILLFLYEANMENSSTVWRKEDCPMKILFNSMDYPQITENPIKLLSTCHMVVLVPTTPANYFHALLRQMSLTFRKPAAIFISNQLFASHTITSDKEDLLGNTRFKTLISDEKCEIDTNHVKRIILCCGELYYLLAKERNSRYLASLIAILRIEQICPFPYKSLAEELELYPNAELIWMQHQPKDRAWYPYVKSRIEAITKGKRKCGYIGRPPSMYKIHNKDFLTTILNQALTIK